MSKTEEIFSVGIDIGTTTTSLVLSKAYHKKCCFGCRAKIEIVDKTVIYRSDVHLHPCRRYHYRLWRHRADSARRV